MVLLVTASSTIGKLIPAGSGIAQHRREQIARQQATAARIAANQPVAAGVVSGSTLSAVGTTSSPLGLKLDGEDDE